MSPQASSLKPDKNISMLLKGPSGFGKTIAACSVAIEGPIYLAYFDKKSPVELLTFYKKHNPSLLDNIEYDIYGSHNVNLFLNKLIEFQNRGCKYVAVIVDSVTNLTSAAVNWSMGFRTAGGKKDKEANDKTTPQLIPDFDEYKVETSLVTQSLDICRGLNCHIIWTCHPLPSLKIENVGGRVQVTKVNNIVTYGSKVGAIIPGNFTEIYHFGFDTSWDSQTGKQSNRRIVHTQGIGDDFAKTALGLPAELDITDKLFFQVWKDEIAKLTTGGEVMK